MTTQNWPDPKRPGVPMFPDQNGLHALKRIEEEGFDLVLWKKGKWIGEDNTPIARKYIARDYCYHGPVLTPTQINEMLAAERERIKSMVTRACNLGNIITPRQRDMIIAGVDSETAIRDLGAAP